MFQGHVGLVAPARVMIEQCMHYIRGKHACNFVLILEIISDCITVLKYYFTETNLQGKRTLNYFVGPGSIAILLIVPDGMDG